MYKCITTKNQMERYQSMNTVIKSTKFTLFMHNVLKCNSTFVNHILKFIMKNYYSSKELIQKNKYHCMNHKCIQEI